MSYILYLVDEAWGSGEKPDGGGLQLYPLEKDGVPGIPAYAPSKTIPPRWNQMVLFAVQPGRSFHDVQEVGIQQDTYARTWERDEHLEGGIPSLLFPRFVYALAKHLSGPASPLVGAWSSSC